MIELNKLGFSQSKNEYSLFVKKQGHSITILAVYVDDILITGNNNEAITSIKQHLDHSFTIKDLGRLHYFLGIEVSYSSQGMCLTQQKYTQDLLAISQMTTFKKVVTPLPLNLKLN